MRTPNSGVTRWLLLIAAVAVVAASYPVWLGAAGSYLVYREEPFQAQMAVVLAGGYRGNRILRAAELVREGFVPRVLVSGTGYYGRSEAELAIDYAVRQGHPREYFLGFAHQAQSTLEEARLVAAELRSLGVKRVLLVTSDYHTRRARACYRKAAPDIELRVIGTADKDFPKPWWSTRQGRKTVFLEWTKTVSWWLER